MGTKGERQALLFLAAVALLGGATRAYHARHTTLPTDDLDRQIGVVETAAHGRRPGRPSVRKRGRGLPSDSIDSGRSAALESTPSTNSPSLRLDLDVATPTDLERLPGVGPSLAKRIIADREAKGPFGCLVAFDAVRGIGPALLARLDSLVSFSGAPRSACGQR